MTDTRAMPDPDAHADPHTSHDDEATDGEPLGEPDLRAWGAALAGAGIAALVGLSLFIATQA
jgi:hypothetical protein